MDETAVMICGEARTRPTSLYGDADIIVVIGLLVLPTPVPHKRSVWVNISCRDPLASGSALDSATSPYRLIDIEQGNLPEYGSLHGLALA